MADTSYASWIEFLDTLRADLLKWKEGMILKERLIDYWTKIIEEDNVKAERDLRIRQGETHSGLTR